MSNNIIRDHVALARIVRQKSRVARAWQQRQHERALAEEIGQMAAVERVSLPGGMEAQVVPISSLPDDLRRIIVDKISSLKPDDGDIGNDSALHNPRKH